MSILSPLNNSSNLQLEREIPSTFIIDLYRNELGVEVGKYFKGIRTVQLYKCLETGYRFYYPFNADGDSDLYEDLQRISWYYMDWKWEHGRASRLINPSDSILEVGCARGGFLDGIKKSCTNAIGLELNVSAANAARAKGLTIFNQKIQEHALLQPDKYDLVCSFQVAEHISSIRDFLQASLDTLKTGGIFVLSVPDNNSLIFRSHKDNALNMPPHHMGLWDANSLIKLQEIFRIQLIAIEFEPLQDYHQGFALTIADQAIKKVADNYGFLSRLMTKVGRHFSVPAVKALTKYMNGHTVMAIFKKI